MMLSDSESKPKDSSVMSSLRHDLVYLQDDVVQTLLVLTSVRYQQPDFIIISKFTEKEIKYMIHF